MHPYSALSRHFPKAIYLAAASLLVLTYLKGLPEEAFIIDDRSLLDIPLMRAKMDIAWWRTLFTPGAHLDFYPFRDLTYWLDIHIFGASTTLVDGTAFRLGNFFWILVAGFTLSRILTRIGISRIDSTLAASLWLLHPLHAETLMWPSARKDALAIAFFAITYLTYLPDRAGESPARSFFAGTGSFVIGLLSKASAALSPFVFLLREGWANGLRKKSTLRYLIPGAISVAYLFVQSRLYAGANDMRYFYTPEHRFAGAVAGFGRATAGIFFDRFNFVDVENWGNWVRLNESFISVGGVALAALLIWTFSELFRLRRRDSDSSFRAWNLLLFWSAYLPVSALLFPHRNFYSVRYFEIPFLVLFILSVHLASKYPKKIFRLGLVFILLLNAGSTYFAAQTWQNGILPLEKGLRVTPENPDLMRAVLNGLRREKAWGRLDGAGLAREAALESKLREICGNAAARADFRNGHLCLSVWIEEFFHGGRLGLPAETRELMLRALADVNPAARASLIDEIELRSGRSAVRTFAERPILPTPEARIYALAAKCIRGDSAAVRRDVSEWRRTHLLDDTVIYRELPQLEKTHPSRVQILSRCFSR